MTSNAKRRSSNFLVQGSILAIASIISRIIGLAYRMVLTNILGDYGNDYYSGAFSVYNILLLISSYSLPLAVSKLVSARMAKKQPKNALRILKSALIFAFVAGSIVALICFFGAEFITKNIMNTPMSVFALKVLSPTLLIVAVMGVIRGYFQGLGTMMPTATSQIIEQIVNAGGSIVGALYLSAYGLKIGAVLGSKEKYSAAYGAAGGTFGTSIGALASIIFLIFLMFSYKKVISRQLKRDHTKYVEPYSEIYKTLFITIVPVIMSTTIYNLNDFLDQAVFKKMMLVVGESASAASAHWGIYSGKYLVLTSVPITIASALSSSIIPSLTAALNVKDMKLVKSKVNTAIRSIMVIAIPCAVGMGVLASPILRLLFHDDSDLSANLLMLGSISIIFFALSTLTNGILQGINKMLIPVRNAVISLVVHIVVLVTIIYTLKIDIYAVVISGIVFSLLMCILNSASLKHYLKYKQEVVKTFVIPALSAAVMGVIVFLVYKGIYMMIHINLIATFVSIFVGVIVYGVLLLALKGFSEEELKELPKGYLILKVAKKLHFYK